MKQICKFKKRSDISRTREGLAVSIPEALDYGKIVDTVGSMAHNGQTDVNSVGTRIREPFDALEYDRAYTLARSEALKADREEKDKDNK